MNPIVNPIVDTQVGPIWGAAILPRTPTAMDRVGIRRLMIYIEKQLRLSAREYLASDGSDSSKLWFDFNVFCLLERIKENKGIQEYQFISDDETLIVCFSTVHQRSFEITLEIEKL